MNVLIVEDNELNIEIAKIILEGEGFNLTCAENGEIAYEKYTGSPDGFFDVILMDVLMPVVDGYKATEMIRKSDKSDAQTIPIIAMTANTSKEDISKALESGMNDYLAKPLDIDKFKSILSKYAK